MRSLTITELERESGVPRSTIYFYVREGLLPTAQKAAASRAVYSERYVELLAEITRLKEKGLGLQAIKEAMAAQVASVGAMDVDLVAEQNEHTRQAILAAAARLFVRKGYKRTRIADIIREVRVTPPVFYSHFESKQALFVEAFEVFVGWMHDFIETPLSTEPDPAARDLARVQGYLGVQTLSPDLLSLVRSEALHEAGAMREVVKRSYRVMTKDTVEDLARIREESGVALPVSDELVTFALLGGVENAVMRASWDQNYSTREVLWTTLLLFLAVQAVYSGRLDLSAELSKYAQVVDQLSETRPPVPPAALR
jgi:AcrR family transcriptional regulator